MVDHRHLVGDEVLIFLVEIDALRSAGVTPQREQVLSGSIVGMAFPISEACGPYITDTTIPLR